MYLFFLQIDLSLLIHMCLHKLLKLLLLLAQVYIFNGYQNVFVISFILIKYFYYYLLNQQMTTFLMKSCFRVYLSLTTYRSILFHTKTPQNVYYVFIVVFISYFFINCPF